MARVRVRVRASIRVQSISFARSGGHVIGVVVQWELSGPVLGLTLSDRNLYA